MADNPTPTPPPNPPPRATPPLKGTGLTGSLKNPTQRLPIPIRTAGGGKIVVMLSSVAKPPPAGTQSLPRLTTTGHQPPTVAAPTPVPPPVEPAATVSQPPPPLPPKQVTPAKAPEPAPQLSTTTYVKLPPKTTAPGWSSLSGKSIETPVAPPPVVTATPVIQVAPPPRVPELTRTAEAKKPHAQHIPPIKLNEPVPAPAPESRAEDSIFLQRATPAPTSPPSAIPKAPMPITTTAPMVRPQAPAPVEAKAAPSLAPVTPAPVTPASITPPAVTPASITPPSITPASVTPASVTPASVTPAATAPEGIPVTLDLFEKSQTPEAKPAPAPAAEAKAAPLKAPALMPPNLTTPPPAVGGGLRPVRPPPLPMTMTKPMQSAPSLSSAKAEKPPELPAEKLPLVEAKAETPVVPPPAPPITPPKLESTLEPVVEKALPFARAGETLVIAPPERLTTPPKLEKALAPAPEPTEKKVLPPVEVKTETPVVAPPALPSAPPPLDKAPEPVAAKLPPPLPKPVEAPVIPGPLLHVAPPMLEKAPEPIADKLPPPLVKAMETPAALHVAPPMLDKAPEPVAEKLPPPLLAKPVEAPMIPGPLVHIAPPMLEKAPEPTAEKLPQPHLPPHAPIAEARKADAPPGSPEPVAKPVQKAPAMIPSETATPKPSAPPKQKRSITSWLKKTTPLVVSSSSTKAPPAPVAEAKPALKPPVLSSRSLLVAASIAEPPALPPVEAKAPNAPKVENPNAIAEVKAPEKAPEKATPSTPPLAPVDKGTPSSALKPALEVAAVAPAAIAAALAADKKKSATKDKPAAKADAKPPSLPPAPKKTEVPLTRAERAKKRRFFGLVFFWAVLFPATIGILFWASLRVGRDTRLEGQVIPPPGTVLSNEVWIVTDFRSLASGITEDLAAERTPLMQEIQERQDHVQRAQADVAAREERIRLIQEEIAAHKAEIEAVVKQARDATQKVWDVDGAAVDNEYASRMNSLKHTIADRAKSLNLNYQPDSEFDSPEVWANAYRLALYQVPAGVDGVKEHAWLSDQMKAWRDYQKTADDSKEALREKAAQIKLGPAPKITDLNAKIDDLQQRIDATEAEEVPLKAELQQAQADLVTAQSADVGLDDKYYKQLYSLPGESVIKRIPLLPNGRFTWLDDNVFLEGENAHSYYIFSRATRADGRQYWSLGRISIEKDHVFPVVVEPNGFVSTKAILRPTLSPDEIEQ